MSTSKFQYLAPFLKIYKEMKIIMTKKLSPKLGIVNGSINYKKKFHSQMRNRYKRHYNASLHKCLNQFQ
jgi:hypothetical protein